MLRTSSQEGGLQQRTESPKATSGVPNGFVRPVAVASIFRPALGGNSGVSAVDGKPAVPEKRRSSAAKEKVFGSSLSNEEFSRRRQSFDTKTATSLGQNVLKEDRSSPSRTLPDSESIQEHIDELLTSDKKYDDRTVNYSETQNAGFKKSKDDNRLIDVTATAKSGGTVEKGSLRTEEKNIKNVSKSSKLDKSTPPESNLDVAKVAPSSEGSVPSIQNGILDYNEVASIVKRPRSRNTGTGDCVQNYDTPQIERRRRSKPLPNTCGEKESSSLSYFSLDSIKTETVNKDDTSFSRNELSVTSTVSSETASKKDVAESVPGALYAERRRRDRTSHTVSSEEKSNVKDTQTDGKDQSSQKVHETNCILNSEKSSSAQTKSELHADAGKPDLISEKRDSSTEALDNQPVGKFRTSRRTSDVIAAKIQTIFSKSDKPSTLPSNKLSSSKSRSGTSVAEIKEEKSDIGSAEKINTSSKVVPEQKVSVVKNLGTKEGSSKISSSDPILPGDVNLPNKSDLAKKQENVKLLEKTEATVSLESKSNQVTRAQSETGNSAVKSDTSPPSINKEKFPVRNRVKENKCNQKSDDPLSVSAQPTVSTVTGNENFFAKPEVFPRGAGNTVITKKELASTVKESVSNFSSSKKEKPTPSAAKKPLASINFFIAEVSVENAPQPPQKISTGKISPLQITSLSVEEKTYATQKLRANKSATDDSKVKDPTPKSEIINSSAVTSKFIDKSKTGGKPLPLKEENKVTPAVQQPKSSQVQKPAVVENTISEAKISEKGQVGKTSILKEVLTENLAEKASQSQKSVTINTTSETKTVKISKSEVVNSAAAVTLKPSEKTKAGKTKGGNKISGNLQEKSGLVQQSAVAESSSSSSETKTVKSTESDILNFGAVVPTLSGSDKVGNKTALSKEGNKVQPQSLQGKNTQVPKTTAEKCVSDDTKAPSAVLVNSGSPVAKAAEKDKLTKTLPPKEENRGTIAEGTLQKSSQPQKIGADVNIISGTKLQALKLSEKGKVDSTSPQQVKKKLESENLRNKSSEVQKTGTEGNLDIKAQSFTSSEKAKSEPQVLSKPPEKDKLGKSLAQKESNKVSNEVLKQKTGQLQKSSEVKTSTDTKSQNLVTGESVNSGAQTQKLSEKDKTEKKSASKEDKVITEKLQPKSIQDEKLCLDESDKKGSELVNSGTLSSKQLETDKVCQGGLQPKENKVVLENLNKRSDIFLKWAAKENASGAVKAKTGPAKNSSVVSDMSCKQSSSTTNKTLVQKSESEMLSENIKQKSGSLQKVSADKPTLNATSAENATPNNVSVNSSKLSDNKEKSTEVKTKPVTSLEAIQNQEQTKSEDKVSPKLKKNLNDETAKYADVKKLTTVKKTTPSVNEFPPPESTAKLPPSGKRVELGQSVLNSQSPTIKRSEKPGEATTKESKQLSVHPRVFPAPGPAQNISGGNIELNVQRDDQKTVVAGQTEKEKPTDTVLTNCSATTETSETKNSLGEMPVKDILVSTKSEAKELKPIMLSENSYFRSKTQEIYGESRKISGTLSASEKDLDDLDDITNMDMVSGLGISSVFNPEFPSRSFSYSKLETPRPPERKRTGFFRETSALTSPPRVPLRTVSRTGSLKRPDDSRFPMERTLSVLRSSSHSVLGPPYTPQRITYTEMLSKLGTCGSNPSAITSNRKFGTSQVSELWADLSEEQTNSAHTSEMLESETSERMRLEKEVHELQSRYSQMQQKSDKMEMEMMEARVYRATEVNGDLSEDEENDATASIYKQKYERAVRDMEIMKRRLQQQHEEEMEQSLMLKKAADKRLTEALEDVEEERQVVNQWKRKAQKLGAELQDLRLMLEEQMARNGELEKKQRRFDAELSVAQEEIRKEHQVREKLIRDKDQAQLEKYSLEQELQATRLDMDMQHEKIALLNRELDELSLSSKGEEEVTQLKRAKQELERKTRDQEEELEELAGQVQMLEQAKLRLEMSLEKLRQEHRRESSVRDEEIEEIRACTSKKIRNLEAQLENEQEERHQLVKQKHELERKVIELSDQPPPQDPEIERRLRRDLKRTKALLRDAQSMLEHMRDGQANKTLIRQLKNQLEDAEFTKSVAIKARQTAELELQELQSQLEEVTRTKNDIESRCLQLSREKSALQTQLEEMEEEMAEVMKKYKAAVAQMSIDQKSLAEQTQQICELESERLLLKEQLAEVSTKLDHISVQTEDSGRVHLLDAKVRDLESKIELEQTTRSRLEHQIARLKEQCDRSREECDSLRNKELQAQEGSRRLQRQLRELREDYAALQQKESEAYRKQHELEMSLENTEADLQVTKNDLRLACQRIQDLQSALEDDLDSGTDVPDESGSDTDSSLDVSVLSRQCLTPLQRSDSVSSNTSIGSDRQFRALSHSQDMAYFSSRTDADKDVNGFSYLGASKYHQGEGLDPDQLESV